MKFNQNYIFIVLVSSVYLLCSSCDKLVEIDPPFDTITTQQVFFGTDDDADAAVRGIYSKLADKSSPRFANGAISLLGGLSADEIELNVSWNDNDRISIHRNLTNPDNGFVRSTFWTDPYAYFYQINSCLEQLPNSSQLSPAKREQFIAEAKFLRALCYFYLINLYGDVPFIESTDWQKTSTAHRTSSETIYQTVIQDLIDAKDVLPSDFSAYQNERVRATSWAAQALLARIYLYKKDWQNAALEASALISSGNFDLCNDPDDVFLANSSESILQWAYRGDIFPYNVIPEGAMWVNGIGWSVPPYYLGPSVLNSFEAGDQRKVNWVLTTEFDGVEYHVPYKYKYGYAEMIPNLEPPQYTVVLRLAEQYLILAEANAELGELLNAITNLNIIRLRAGLSPVSASLTKEQLLDAVMQERKIEYFAEWGHRWFDLKRSGSIDEIMPSASAAKGGSWESFKQLFPIPRAEIQMNPNLTQNPGYQ